MDCEIHKLFGEDRIDVILIIHLKMVLASYLDHSTQGNPGYRNVLCSNHVVPGMGWDSVYLLVL